MQQTKHWTHNQSNLLNIHQQKSSGLPPNQIQSTPRNMCRTSLAKLTSVGGIVTWRKPAKPKFKWQPSGVLLQHKGVPKLNSHNGFCQTTLFQSWITHAKSLLVTWLKPVQSSNNKNTEVSSARSNQCKSKTKTMHLLYVQTDSRNISSIITTN
jgi:hypothetical protein